MYSQIVMVARVRWFTTVARTIFRPSVSGKTVILGKSKTGMLLSSPRARRLAAAKTAGCWKGSGLRRIERADGAERRLGA
jgi:hypothetical protein